MMTRAAIGILCLAVLAIGLWWIVPPDPADPLAEPAPSTAQPIPGIPSDAFEMTVESVHDGDTLRPSVSEPNAVVSDTGSTRVRLIGLDTPEISSDLQCWGAEATARLDGLLPSGTTVWVAPDLEVLDRYGRHLLYVWTPDGRFVNAELVAEGNGTVMIFAPNTEHEPLFRALEAEAVSAGRGVWGSC